VIIQRENTVSVNIMYIKYIKKYINYEKIIVLIQARNEELPHINGFNTHTHTHTHSHIQLLNILDVITTVWLINET
jgi:hypothetical protein